MSQEFHQFAAVFARVVSAGGIVFSLVYGILGMAQAQLVRECGACTASSFLTLATFSTPRPPAAPAP